MAEITNVSIMAELHYADPAAALAWLAAAFGCQTRLAVAGDDGALVFATTGWGDQELAVIPQTPPHGVSPGGLGGIHTQRLQVSFSGDLHAHCEAARAAGARIVAEPQTVFYGVVYSALDPEGHLWTFRQSIETSGPLPEGWSVGIGGPGGDLGSRAG